MRRSCCARRCPHTSIEVFERNRPDDTFGWGVVFSDQTMANFRTADPESHAAILANFHHWDDIAIYFRGARLVSGGHGFCGIGRKRLLGLLQERAREVGVRQVFQHEVDAESAFADADLVVAADGLNSRTRTRHAEVFEPDIDVRKCRFIWLGTTRPFAEFTFAFEQTEHGWFQIHAYQFSADLSTVIVETREETWRAHGLDSFSTEQSIAFCERLFAQYLDGHRLQSNANHLRGSAWLNFPRVQCKRWHHGKFVLIGDAAHTAHFSIGSGTKLAMEDAISLTQHVAGAGRWRRRWKPTSASATPRCSSCRAPRATAWNGSRTWRATCTCRQRSSPTACSPAASALATRTSSCATRASWPTTRAGSRSVTARRLRDRRCSCPSRCAT